MKGTCKILQPMPNAITWNNRKRMWWLFATSTNPPNVHVKSASLGQRALASNRYLDMEDISKGLSLLFSIWMVGVLEVLQWFDSLVSLSECWDLMFPPQSCWKHIWRWTEGLFGDSNPSDPLGQISFSLWLWSFASWPRTSASDFDECLWVDNVPFEPRNGLGSLLPFPLPPISMKGGTQLVLPLDSLQGRGAEGHLSCCFWYLTWQQTLEACTMHSMFGVLDAL